MHFALNQILGACLIILLSNTAYSEKINSTSPATPKTNSQAQKTTADLNQLMQQAEQYFEHNQHTDAIEIYDLILQQQPDYIDAYFGRGMARGRAGFIQDGIDDLSIFIKHHPDSSLAFTKRGVRYLWLGKNQQAMHDFLQAIKLDPHNAEAHDDLGVIYAQSNQPDKAIEHFSQTIKYEPSYQKAYHNLALTYFIYDNSVAALDYVDKALALLPDSKNTLLLKSEILKTLGKLEQAQAIKDEAMFLPDGNWSEAIAIE